MKKIVIGFHVIGAILLGSVALQSCNEKLKKGDPSVERNFQGDWETEYRIDNENMRLVVKEKVNFDTLTHRYKVEQVQELIFPVNIKYADLSYEGVWSADKDYLYGRIDESTIKNELNPKFDEDEVYKDYYEIVKETVAADMKKDDFMVRKITSDRIHLFDKDRTVAHDLIRPAVSDKD